MTAPELTGVRTVRRAGSRRPRPALRAETGPGALLTLIRDLGSATRRDLIAHTGFARATLEARLDTLLNAGYIVERIDHGSSGGRPPRLIEFNENGGHLLCVDIGATHTTIGIADLGCHILAKEDLDIDVTAGPAAVLGAVGSRLRRLVERLNIPPATVLGVGVGVPSPVEWHGRMARPPHAAPLADAWVDIVIAREILAFLPGLGVTNVPVVVDKDANIMALGEWRTSWPDVRDLVVVKISTTIACGIITGGHVVRGVAGMAGDLAHIPDPHDHTPCRCGQHGCLDVTASGLALLRRTRTLHDTHPSDHTGAAAMRHLVDRTLTGDPTTVHAMTDAGHRLGQSIGALIALLNPELVVVGGALAHDNTPLISTIRHVAAARVHPHAASSTQIVASSIRAEASLIGAAHLALDEILTPATVDSALADR
ncbi:N-acetylmannosamine kinase [Austwickia sp. TVS 96-490-7B]|uniref:ROK family protein n=1 Tax=Austwickia sp. TVS 96-490-7B TaxID=2830843 RepID=UPI001C5A46D7|nr:ROK family protein [Austwickia sp. TVS 96-490-7B]MBW3087056.1 N-acetylmannosamine kinase [Austwickia sp. TVS 96-490-7B]